VPKRAPEAFAAGATTPRRRAGSSGSTPPSHASGSAGAGGGAGAGGPTVGFNEEFEQFKTQKLKEKLEAEEREAGGVLRTGTRVMVNRR
jgi:hypothetical protein